MSNRKYKILLIEDDKDQIYLYTTKMEMEGLTVISALTGADGIAKAIKEKPDFILLDLIISDMGGLEVLTKLKANDKTKKIPLALLTNLTKKELAREAIGLGAIDFWPKTEVLPSEIVRRIKAILKIK